MDAPKELTAKEKTVWGKLFKGFRPKSQIEIEMAKRYVFWFQVFESESKKVAKGDTFAKHAAGVGQSVAFKNCCQAETEMRRLRGELDKSFVEVKDEEDVGQFEGL